MSRIIGYLNQTHLKVVDEIADEMLAITEDQERPNHGLHRLHGLYPREITSSLVPLKYSLFFSFMSRTLEQDG